MKKYLLAFGLFAAIGLSPLAQNAHAWVGVRIGIGVPLYVGPGPYYGYPYYPYYYPPAVVAPAPAVVYQTAPAAAPAAVYQTAPPAAPIVVRSQSGEMVAAPSSAPTPIVSAPPPPPTPLPPVTNVITVSNETTQINGLVRQLTDPSDTVRRDAAIELGRQKAQSAIDPLLTMLSRDSSATAREGAARALGLIASPRSLNPLIFAAQADNDREVRHSTSSRWK